jgi:hypothetical protein
MSISWQQIKQVMRHQLVQLGLIVLLALGLRLYKITNPILDWHAFRQADTAAVTRHYVKNGIDLTKPRYHDLSNIQSGQPNPEGYRMVEFPLVNGMTALLIRALPQLDLVITSRFISVLFSLGTLLSLYWFTRQVGNRIIANLASLFFAIIPYAVFYSRVILPEPAMLFFSTLSLASFAAYTKTKNNWSWLISLVGLSLACLLKPFVIFLAPVYLTLILVNNQQLLKQIKTWVHPILAIIPLVLWRNWIKQFPSGIPASDWLFNSNKIRFRPAWFRWLFFERLTKLILGFAGLIWLPFNFLEINKLFWILLSWAGGLFTYLAVIATGNVQHDYYQVLLIPAVCLAAARGVSMAQTWLEKRAASLIKKLGFPTRLHLPQSQPSLFGRLKIASLISYLIIGLVIIVQLVLSWQQVKNYYQINHRDYLKAGQAVDKLLPAEAKVIAPANGDTMFLFQTNRRGWPLGVDIKDKINQGATHYVTVNDDNVAQDLEEKYATVKKTSDYLILDLTQPKQ